VQAEAGTEGLKIQYGQGGTIEGRVLLPDGNPAAQAWVSASAPEGSSWAQTGSDGRFTMKEVTPGTYQVNAGLQRDGKSLRGSAAAVSVSAGVAATGTEITLQAAE
jgi:hypothetical protein